jgi:hypothetical protein
MKIFNPVNVKGIASHAKRGLPHMISHHQKSKEKGNEGNDNNPDHIIPPVDKKPDCSQFDKHYSSPTSTGFFLFVPWES